MEDGSNVQSDGGESDVEEMWEFGRGSSWVKRERGWLDSNWKDSWPSAPPHTHKAAITHAFPPFIFLTNLLIFVLHILFPVAEIYRSIHSENTGLLFPLHLLAVKSPFQQQEGWKKYSIQVLYLEGIARWEWEDRYHSHVSPVNMKLLVLAWHKDWKQGK